MSAETIIGIVVLVIALVVIFGGLFWVQSKNK